MYNAPTIESLRNSIPQLYSTEHIPLKNKIIRAHIWIASCDWFVVEFDGHDLMFCFAILNGNYRDAEWGYVSLSELMEIDIDGLQTDFDIYWTPCPASKVRTICKAHGWLYKQPAFTANLTA